MANLPIDAIQKTTPLDGLKQAFRVDTPERVAGRAIDIAAVTGSEVNGVALKTSQGDNSPILAAKATTGDTVQSSVANSYQAGLDPQAASVALLDAQDKRTDLEKFSDFTLEGAMTVGDPNYNPSLARAKANQQIAFEVFEERFKGAQEQGIGSTVVDFLDRYVLRQVAFGVWEDLTKRSERKGLELAQAAASMGHDEYREFISNYADELANEGVLTSENYFALMDGINEAENAGYDPTNAGLNQILAIPDLLGIGKIVKSSGRIITRVGATRGVKAADEAVDTLITAGARDNLDVADELLPDHLSVTKDSNVIGPTQSRTDNIFKENKLVQDIQHLYKSGTFGRIATPEQIQEATSSIVENLRGIVSRPIARTDVYDTNGLGNFAAVTKLGTEKTGAPFSATANGERAANLVAKKLNDQGIVSYVSRVDEGDPSKGFYVSVEQSLDLTAVAKPIDVDAAFGETNNAIQRALSSSTRGLQSARATDDPFLATLANMGESGNSAVADLAKPYLKSLSELSYDSKFALNAVYRELRDGGDAFIRNGYTENELRVKFKAAHPKGLAPTDKDMEAFAALQTMNDAAYILSANRLARRYVTRGYKSITLNDVSVPAKPFNGSLERGTLVWNASRKQTIYSQDIDAATQIWRTDREIQGGLEYVIRPDDVRSIQYDDVLGYNAGGNRLNPNTKYFVTSGEGRGRALIGASSEAQAKLAARQLEEIFSVARKSVRNLGDLVDELDDVIGRNLDWNPSIHSTKDFVDLAKRKGWNITDRVSFKQRDGIVEAPTDQADDLFDGMTNGEYVQATQRRNDDVLMDFGGQEVGNDSPVSAITSQLSNAVTEFAFANYTYQAKAAWLKKALRTNTLPNGTDVNRLFRETTADGPGATDRKLRSLRAIIERREGKKSQMVQQLSDYGEQLSEFVLDKTGKKISPEGLEGKLLGFGFQSAFGFLNVSQLFLQATHALSIMSISPTHGARAAGLILPVRMAVNSPAPGLALKRMAKTMGVKEDELVELAELIKTSGRNNVEADAIQNGQGAGFGVSSWEGQDLRPSVLGRAINTATSVKNVVAEKGIMFFNAGERISRHTAIITAGLEYKAKYGGSILTDEARFWITRREQDLSFNMTTTSRAAWQSGVLKIPTQWLSYSLRSMEAITVGRGFTAGERTRLAAMMAIQSGTAGTLGVLGFDAAADQIGEMFGVEPDSPAYAGLKYGIWDAIGSYGMSAITGENIRTAFGTRVAPLTAFTDLYRKATEESLLVAVGGPSGEIAGGTVSALLSVGGGILSGNFRSAAVDIERVLRTPSGIDNIVKAAGMMNHGVYRSKTGTTMPSEFSNIEAVLQGAGVTNFKVAEFYDRRTTAFRESKGLKDFQKDITARFRRGLDNYESDPEGGLALMREVEAMIELSGFSPVDIMKLRRGLRADLGNDIVDLSLRELQKGNDYGARVVESIK